MANHLYLKGVAFVGLAALCWSSAGLFIKLVQLPPVPIALFRSLIAGVFLGVYVAVQMRRGPVPGLFTPSRHTFITAVLYMLTVTLFVMANKLTTSANAVFLQYTAPAYVIVISFFLLKERVQWMEIVTIVVCLSGMALFFLEENKSASIVGNVIGILSGVSFALLQVNVRVSESSYRTDDNPRGDQLRATFNLAMGNLFTVLTLASIMVSVTVMDVDTGSFVAGLVGNRFDPSVADWLGLLFLGVFQLGLGYLFFARGAKLISSVEVSIYTLFEPISNPVWTYLGTGEVPGAWAILGGTLILGAIVANTLFEKFKVYR
jgi:drug/metabolite transporter (DMT)-like permease